MIAGNLMKYLLLTGLLVFASNALAAIITLPANYSGYYTDTGFRNGNQAGIDAGESITAGGPNTRNWISFDLNSVSDEIFSASLAIYNHADNDSGINFTWSEIDTSITDLLTDGGIGVDIYADLGTGSVFASGVANADGIDNYTLTGAALASLNNVIDSTGFWAMAGSTEGDLDHAYAYTSGVSSGDLIQLTLVTHMTVPLPAAFWLFLSGLVSMAGIARRKRFQQQST